MKFATVKTNPRLKSGKKCYLGINNHKGLPRLKSTFFKKSRLWYEKTLAVEVTYPFSNFNHQEKR